MKRIRLGARLPALVFFAPFGGGVALLHGCIPEADISGLPPYDAGVIRGTDATVPVNDSGADTSLPGVDAGDSSKPDTGPKGASIVGVVIDYTQAKGRGVVPGATVVVNGTTVTSKTDGTFVVPVAAGHYQVSVGKATDKVNGIAYSSTQVIVDVADGATVAISPVLHEGCVVTQSMTSATQTTVSETIKTGSCVARTGAFLALSFPGYTVQSPPFVDATTGTGFSGTARFELIPIAYPAADFSWALGLPGSSPLLGAVGAAEVRVVDDATGAPLQVATGKSVTLTIPTTAAQAQPATLTAASYDATNGQWRGEGQATVAATKLQSPVPAVDVTAQHLTWWAVATPTAPAAGCIAGTLTADDVAAPGVLVHGYGVGWFGHTTTLTDATGAFCLDVQATSNVAVSAGAVTPSGLHTVSMPLSTQSSASGSCAGGAAACAQAGSIDMAALGTACTSGTITDSQTGDAGTGPLALWLQQLPLGTADPAAGISPAAYVGEQALGAGGTFCADVPAGAKFRFLDPNPANAKSCGGFPSAAPSIGSNSPLTAPASGGTACAGANCADAGNIFYGCY